MIYQISQISNRDVVLLYEYRILRTPPRLLAALYRYDVPEILYAAPSDFQKQDDYWVMTWDISTVQDKIPYLEFYQESYNPNDLANLVELEISASTITLRSSDRPERILSFRVYWVRTLNQISSILTEIRKAIQRLQSTIQTVESANSPADTTKMTLTGVEPNLINISGTISEQVPNDSGYMLSGAVAEQILINPKPETLSHMLKTVKNKLILRIIDNIPRVIQGFSGGIIEIYAHTKTLIIRDCTCIIRIIGSDIETLILENVPNSLIESTNTVKIGMLELRNTSLTLKSLSRINQIALYKQSLCIHTQGIVHQIILIDSGSCYHVTNANAVVEQISANDIQGVFQIGTTTASTSVYWNKQSVDTRKGQVDDPLPISQVHLDITLKHTSVGPTPIPPGEWENLPANGEADIMLIYDAMRDSGWTREAAIGALANMKHESGWFTHMIQGNSTYFVNYGTRSKEELLPYMNSAVSGNDLYTKIQATSTNGDLVGYGLVQFTSLQNQSALYDQHTATNLEYDRLGVQIPAFKQVLQANHLWDTMNAQSTPGDAAYYLCMYYEIPAQADIKAAERRTEAENLAQQYDFR